MNILLFICSSFEGSNINKESASSEHSARRALKSLKHFFHDHENLSNFIFFTAPPTDISHGLFGFSSLALLIDDRISRSPRCQLSGPSSEEARMFDPAQKYLD